MQQVEAAKTAMDWRALVSDMLTLERRSVGVRPEFQLLLQQI